MIIKKIAPWYLFPNLQRGLACMGARMHRCLPYGKSGGDGFLKHLSYRKITKTIAADVLWAAGVLPQVNGNLHPTSSRL